MLVEWIVMVVSIVVRVARCVMVISLGGNRNGDIRPEIPRLRGTRDRTDALRQHGENHQHDRQ